MQPVVSLKREFSDDDEEYEDISDDDDGYFNHSGPINLSKVAKVEANGGGDTWRPW